MERREDPVHPLVVPLAVQLVFDERRERGGEDRREWDGTCLEQRVKVELETSK